MRLPKFLSSRLIIPADIENSHSLSNPPSFRPSPNASGEDLPLQTDQRLTAGGIHVRRHSQSTNLPSPSFPSFSKSNVSSQTTVEVSNPATPKFDSLASPTNTLTTEDDESNVNNSRQPVLNISLNSTSTSAATTIVSGSRSSSGSSTTDDDFDRVSLLKGVHNVDDKTAAFDYYNDQLPTTPNFEKSNNNYPFYTTNRNASTSSMTLTQRIFGVFLLTFYYIKRAFNTFKRVCRGHFIINSSITVPLWLIFALIFLFWVGVFTVVTLLIIGNLESVSNRIVHSTIGRGPIREINGKVDRPFVLGCTEPQTDEPRANAVLIVLARNKEYEGVVSSMQSLERHFNRWFHYPYIFFNDEPFNSTFKEAVQNATDSKVEFGVLDSKTWNFPSWADVDEIEESIALQGDRAIMYGGMASYHRMCRFYSGAFFHHPMLQKYEWYWRVEPDVKYFCDITYDPFRYMEKNNKVYGFTIVIKELAETVPNLFRYTHGFKKARNITSKGMWEFFLKKNKKESADSKSDSKKLQKQKIKDHLDNIKKNKEILALLQETLPDEAFVGDPLAKQSMYAGKELEPLYENDQLLDIDNYDYFAHNVPSASIDGETYNMCHFWSNFEIARLDFFRSKEYQDYFETLDRSGGFWKERWGDAPVHSLAAGLFLSPEQVHYFRDIGYRHTTIQHCPANAPGRQLPHMSYIRNATDREEIKEDEYWANPDPEVTNGVGCRCRCDTDLVEVEGKAGSCLSEWVDLVGGWV